MFVLQFNSVTPKYPGILHNIIINLSIFLFYILYTFSCIFPSSFVMSSKFKVLVPSIFAQKCIFVHMRIVPIAARASSHHRSRYKMFTGLETDHVLSLATNNRGALTAE